MPSTWIEAGRQCEDGEKVLYAPALEKPKRRVLDEPIDWKMNLLNAEEDEDFLSMPPPPPPVLMRQNAVLSVDDLDVPKSEDDSRNLGMNRPMQWKLRQRERSAVWSMPRGVQRLPP